MSDLTHVHEGIEYALYQSETLLLSPYGAAAEHLWNLGYSPLPLVPREKFPAFKDWPEFCGRAPTTHELWKLVGRYRHGDYNIGIACGTPIDADHILIAVDIDCDDERLIAAVPQSTMAKASTNHGETRFFRASPEITSAAYDRLTENGGQERLVDILAGGRQTAVPGSVHPNGYPYRWLKPPVPVQELPVFDDDDMARLLDTIDALGGFRTAARVERTNPGTFGVGGKWRDCNESALANLDAWVPSLPLFGLRRKRGGFEAVADWRPSSSGRALAQRRHNLSIVPHGIQDFGTGEKFSPIDLVATALGIEPGPALDWLKTRLGIEDDDGANLVIIDRKKERMGDAQRTDV